MSQDESTSKSRLAAFLSGNPRRSEWYDALCFSDQFTFRRALDAWHGELAVLLEEEKPGYAISKAMLWTMVLMGFILYLVVILCDVDRNWIAYLVFANVVAMGLTAWFQTRILDCHLRKFHTYDREARAACVGVMKFMHEYKSRPAIEYWMAEFLAAPVSAVLAALSILTEGPSDFLGLD